MNRRHSQPRVPAAGPAAAARRAEAATSVQRLRQIHRAASDLRRGVPVLLTGGGETLALLAAEAASPQGLAELAALATEPPVVLLAPTRGAAVLRRPVEHGADAVALRLSDAVLEPEALRRIADPTLAQPRGARPAEPAPLPPLASGALALVKLAQLLPAVLAARVRGPAEGLLDVAAADLLAYPIAAAAGLHRVAAAQVPLSDAPDARVVAFRSEGTGVEHLAILVGEPDKADAPLVRIHSECFTGDLLGSLRCDCGQQLRGAVRRMAEEGAGVLLYLAQEGRGIGLVNKLRAYALQDRGLDTLDANRALGWDADERNFLIAARMLEALGITRVRLLTNNPDKLTALEACGVQIVGREPHTFAPNGVNDEYLATKAARFGHMLD